MTKFVMTIYQCLTAECDTTIQSIDLPEIVTLSFKGERPDHQQTIHDTQSNDFQKMYALNVCNFPL